MRRFLDGALVLCLGCGAALCVGWEAQSTEPDPTSAALLLSMTPKLRAGCETLRAQLQSWRIGKDAITLIACFAESRIPGDPLEAAAAGFNDECQAILVEQVKPQVQNGARTFRMYLEPARLEEVFLRRYEPLIERYCQAH